MWGTHHRPRPKASLLPSGAHPRGWWGVKTEVLAIHEDADTEAFRLLEKVCREHKRVRENEKNRLKFEAGQAATRKAP